MSNSEEIYRISNIKCENLNLDYDDKVAQQLLNNLLNKNFSRQEAANFWQAALHNYKNDNTNMNWRSVILDYLLRHTELLKNPQIIEAKELKQLQINAVTDGLTKLYNQSYFKQRLAATIQDHQLQQESSFALLLLDLDRFKQFNDRCGHLRGDQALQKVGKLICSQLPAKALAARYGGEEFAIILPETTRLKALQIAEQIRALIAATKFEGEDRLDNGKLTVSGGVACYPEAGITSDKLLDNADGKLYEAKIHRNSISPRPIDSRAINRHSYRSIVEISPLDSASSKNSLSSDISPTGILLKSSSPEVLGSNLKLHFPYPFWPSSHNASGEVRHVRKEDHRGTFLIGVEFLQPQCDFVKELLPATSN